MSKHDKAQDKTNAMRMFDAAGLPHEVLFYDAEAAVSGAEVAAALGQDPDQVFKTLVTVGTERRALCVHGSCRGGAES